MEPKDGLSNQLQSLRRDLERSFEKRDWNGLAGALEAVAKVGESQGSRELCLRAQSLSEMARVGQAGALGTPRATDVFGQVIFHLSHVEWRAQDAAGDRPPRGAG